MRHLKKAIALICTVACIASFASVCFADTEYHAIIPRLTREIIADPEEIKDLGIERLNEICDLIIDYTTTEDMEDWQKAYAVYQWIENNINYVDVVLPHNWQEAALQVFNTYAAECYGFYAALRAVFERLGFKCIEMEEGGDFPHFWLMFYVEGAWWHCDATVGWGGERFMRITEWMQNFLYRDNWKYPRGMYYYFDKSKLPKTLKDYR